MGYLMPNLSLKTDSSTIQPILSEGNKVVHTSPQGFNLKGNIMRMEF